MQHSQIAKKGKNLKQQNVVKKADLGRIERGKKSMKRPSGS